MAKLGEGDKRWIVQERPDGTNVHNWHWSEKDCLQWSKTRLAQLLDSLTVLDEEALSIKITAVEKIEGEAYVNIRKGKVIPGYEISLTVSWSGETKEPPTGVAEGTLHFPYIADENAGEDPEIRVSVKDEGPVAEKLRQAFVDRGKPVVLAQVRKYVEHMTAGGPAKDELESKLSQSKSTPVSTSTPAPTSTTAPVSVSAGPAKPVKKTEPTKEGFKTIRVTEKFNCRARDIYEVLMDENRWKGFTQSNAKISREVGGEFSVFNGAIMGVNQELQQDKLIVQKWRSGSWPDGLYSMVTITLEEPEVGITVVKLTQTDIPEEDRFGNATVVENTERGWREHIFNRIRAVFGYGI
ncbi:hypothetical protein SUGI_0663860 [Cryptomeria japonica]|uniref:uncharacterized protein LOC131039072 n=1 Tax=Cryptomeria japonica TaxID=3369 RepID=UPI0024149F05|nr:uncharacterized protein LOC131039072 [Cryptomeria japonica]GLJ32966.1 hypothetical protein SUGI_0663860 [Cryptomeria japonica]